MSVSHWQALRQNIEASRDAGKLQWESEIIKTLGRAADAGLCEEYEKFRVKKRNHAIAIEPRAGVTMPAVKADVPAIALAELPNLADAKLAFRVALRRDGRIEQYTMSVVGTDRNTLTPWYVRIDLDEEQKGQGPCGHPLLHAHVGSDPSNKEAQPVRVPLPWLAPHQALEWILSNVAGLEPG